MFTTLYSSSRPEWGPASHNPENPHSHEATHEAVAEALDQRDGDGERPDDN